MIYAYGKEIKLLKVFPKYGVDKDGFLYKIISVTNVRALKPRIHGLAPHSAPVRFYISVDGKKYSVSQENLRGMQENVIFRMEK